MGGKSGTYDGADMELSVEPLPRLRVKRGSVMSVQIGGSSWWMSGLILCNIVLGTGLLNMPEAFKESGGILHAVMSEMVCILLILLGYYMICTCTNDFNDLTYQAVVRSLCGKVALSACSAAIFVHNFGTCIALMVLLGDQSNQFMKYIIGSEFCDIWYLRRSVTVPICSVLLILPFCFSKRMDGCLLKIVSCIGILSTVCIVVVILLKYFTLDPLPEVVLETTRTYSWMDSFKAFPVLCFSFEGHIEAVPIYACLKNRNISEIMKALTLSTFVAMLVYTTVGTFGYLTAGYDVTSDILLYYRPDIPVITGTVVVALKCISTYPCVFYCARLVIDDVVKSLTCLECMSCDKIMYAEVLLMFTSSLAVAMFIPTIGTVIKLLGGSAALFIMVFPGLCFIKHHLYTEGKLKYTCTMALGVATVCIGTFLAAISTIYSVMNYMADETGSNEQLECNSI